MTTQSRQQPMKQRVYNTCIVLGLLLVNPTQATPICNSPGECKADLCNYSDALKSIPGLTNLGATTNILTGRREILFDVETYSDCRICGGGLYQCPDAIQEVVFREREWKSMSETSSESAKETMKTQNDALDTSMGIKGGNSIYSGHMSASYSINTDFMLQESESENTRFSRAQRLVQKYQYQLTPKQFLTATAFRDLSNVAYPNGDDPIKMQRAIEFINNYGTHIMLEEPVGGYQELTMSFKANDYDKLSKDSKFQKGCLEVGLAAQSGFYDASFSSSACAARGTTKDMQEALAKTDAKQALHSVPPLQGDLHDDGSIEKWKQVIQQSPQPIDPWMGAPSLRDQYRSTDIWNVVDFVKGDQKKDLGDLEDLRSTLLRAAKSYLRFYDPANCNNICGTGGNAVVETTFDESLQLPFVEPQNHCKCACEANAYGKTCANIDAPLTKKELHTMVSERCHIRFHQTDFDRESNEIDIQLGKGSKSLKFIGELDGSDRIYYSILCDTTCNEPGSKCTKGSNYSNALNDLGSLCIKMGWADDFKKSPSTNMEANCAANHHHISSFHLGGQVDSSDSWFFEAFVHGEELTPMKTFLRNTRLLVKHYDVHHDHAGEISFAHDYCHAIKQTECLNNGLYKRLRIPLMGEVDSNDKLVVQWI